MSVVDRAHIGFTTEPTEAVVDAWRVKLFCQAIGETDAVYWEPGVARERGLPGCPVPPTFLKALEGEHFSSAAILQHLQVPVRRVLHAEQSFDYFAALYVGQRVRIRRRISDIQDKKGGALTFVLVDTDYHVGERAVASSRQSILVRNPQPTHE
ncbi:MaoC family dehydratase N-terminal domain-containing protein [Hydrogenophaga sp.]|uniref:FAS1-like dehydratase domain-containing protein n=1 Tax=Hydrogenophaga sp. TaxID=1904254 RepID=UPI002624E612|nr:MaoC family dehydratase N-terminal domain-containing protein [Hydrogenophaga sp.]MCW5652131.1 MaoC family dehydratase N-terminal domain-containing protein [Hydrogenophaga sp.]